MDYHTSRKRGHLPPCAAIGNLAKAHEFLARGGLEPAWQSGLDALRVRPFHPEAYLLLAQIAFAAGAPDAARLCAEQARKLAPKWQPAHEFLNRKLSGGHP